MSVNIDLKTFNVKNGNYIGKYQYYSTTLNKTTNRYVAGVYSMMNHNTAIYTGKWPVVQDSLVAYYDFAEYDSYTGTGSTIFDLSTNVRTITATGSYSSSNSGIWTLSSNQFLSLTSNYAFGTSDNTLEAWLYPTSYPSGVASGMIFGSGGSNFSGVLYFGYHSGGYYYFGGWDGTTRWGTSITPTSAILNNWAYVAFGRSGSVWRAYVGSTNGNTTTISTANVTFSTSIGQSGPRLGSNASNGSECYNGYVGMFRAHNRYLSNDELFNNFNCQRRRFGI